MWTNQHGATVRDNEPYTAPDGTQYPGNFPKGEIPGLTFVADPEPTPQTPEQLAALQAAKVGALWRAADAYTSRYISGVAVGLLTIGVMQGRPKALAITAWSSSVWDAYYTRKALVTAASVDDLDFASLGPMPYSVPELRAELGM